MFRKVMQWLGCCFIGLGVFVVLCLFTSLLNAILPLIPPLVIVATPSIAICTFIYMTTLNTGEKENV